MSVPTVVASEAARDMIVQYRKGVEIPLADVLSQVTPLPMEENGIQLPIIAVNLVTASIPHNSNVLHNIQQKSAKDPTFKVLMHYINIGWPFERKKLPTELHPYWNFRDELSVEDGLLPKGSRLLIPSTLRSKTLEQIHEGHQGI